MAKQIVILQGHPNSGGQHLCHALADAYVSGANEAGFAVNVIDVAALDFPFLRSASDWNEGDTPAGVKEAQDSILNADHLVIIYPLWLGTMPALLKAFLEQVLRPGLAGNGSEDHSKMRTLLKGKSARIVITMGMPALAYSLFYRKHSLKSLQRNILAFVGVRPVRTTLIGLVENMKPARAKRLMAKMKVLGRSAK